MGLVAAGLTFSSASAASGDIGYVDQSKGATGHLTGAKPESKLWFNDGAWWASMLDTVTNHFFIYKLDTSTQQWSKTSTQLDDRAATRSDVLWDGTNLWVASHLFNDTNTVAANGAQVRIYKYSYNTTTKAYTLVAGFPVVPVTGFKPEAFVIAKDTKGVVWATWMQPYACSGGTCFRPYLTHTSNAAGTTWVTPYQLPGATPATNDDISSIIAFRDNGGDKVGVMWSDQNAKKDFFSVHVDGAVDTTWSATPETALGDGTNTFADDHLNLKTDSIPGSTAGNVYVAVKTNLTTGASPVIELLRRTAAGVWSSYVYGLGSDSFTRPILELDTTHNVLHLLATCPQPPNTSGQSGGDICEKSSPTSSISFQTGRGVPVIHDSTSADMDDVSSTKQNLTGATGMVVIASNDSTDRYWHAFNSLAAPVAPTIGAATISGNAVEGQTLTAGATNVTGTPTPVASYQWETCSSTGASCHNVTGAAGIAQSYTIPTGSAGSTVKVTVTETNSANHVSASALSAVITATASGAPTQVTTSAATNIASTTATLNGSANPHGLATNAWFRWSTANPGTCNNSFGTATAPTSSLGSGTTSAPFTFALTGLSSSTTYFYCAIAQNTGGLTLASNVVSFTTSPSGGAGAPTQVTTSAATGITSAGATLNGSANPNGAATNGYFRWSTANPGTCNNSFGTATAPTSSLGSGSSSAPFTFALTGQSPGTTIYFCALATNTNGTTAASNLLNFTTSASGGSGASANFEAGTSGATITANDPGSATKWDQASLSSSTLIYDAGHARGSLAAKLATSAGMGSPYLGWTSTGLGGTPSDWYGRLYLYLPANLPSDSRIVQMRSSGSAVAALRLRSDGKIDLLDAAGTARATTTKALTLNAWNRIEWHVVNNATTGSLECKLFLGANADGTTADDTTAFANFSTGTNTDNVRFGFNTSGASLGPMWLDNIVANTSAYPGPG